MTSKFNQFVVQAEHNLSLLNDCMYHKKATGEPGIRDFHSQMIDVYNRYVNDVLGRVTERYGDSKLSQFIRDRKLTNDDIFKLFLMKQAGYDCSPSRLAESLERMMTVSSKLNKSKNKALYAPRGITRNRAYKDLLLDFNGLCYKNERFKVLNEKTQKLFVDKNSLAEVDAFGKVTPLTQEQIDRYESLEKKYYEIIRDYNESVLDEEYGIKRLYSAVRKLITEKLCEHGVTHVTRKTSFEDKYAIPAKYKREQEFNPYYVARKKKIEDLMPYPGDGEMFYM